MNILKSLLVIIGLSGLVGAVAFMIYRRVRKKEGKWMPGLYQIAIWAAIALAACLLFGEYTYPFEQTVELELYATLEIDQEHTLDRPQAWHAAYEKYGIYAGSLWFETDMENQEYYLGFRWPEMDFEHYTYIISYGQTVESLSYNVWETIDYQLQAGVKVGHAELGDEFHPNAVYIYQIKKMRIDNDI